MVMLPPRFLIFVDKKGADSLIEFCVMLDEALTHRKLHLKHVQKAHVLATSHLLEDDSHS